MLVAWEDGRLGIMVDADNESFGERGSEEKEEGDGEERGEGGRRYRH